MAQWLPTGEQYELRHRDQRAVVVQVGGGLREYTAGDRAVVDGFPASSRIDGGRGQLLVPWPNRIRDGRYPWGGKELQLALTEPTAGNAIHGLLRWVSWDLIEREDGRVALGATVWPQPGYPFLLAVRAEYALGPEGLSVTVTAENTGGQPAPYGVGQHPYLTVGTERVDEAVLTVPAGRWIRTDERGIPTSSEDVAGSAYDFRDGRPIADLRLDTCYADLDADASGRVTVRVAHPSGSLGVDVWMDPAARFVQVFTGDTLPDPQRRRGGLAVEPMSCPADAFRSGSGLTVLDPGRRHVLQWGLRPW